MQPLTMPLVPPLSTVNTGDFVEHLPGIAVPSAFYSLSTRAWQLAAGGMLAAGTEPLPIGINVPIQVPFGHFNFGGDRDSMFGALKMRGQDGLRFFTRVKEVTSRWPDPSLRGVNLGFPRNT